MALVWRGRREGRVSTDTRGPRAERLHGAGTTGAAGRPGPPCAMALTAASRSPWCAGFLATIPRATPEHRHEVDISIGMSGPRDLTVRRGIVRRHDLHAAPHGAHRIPHPTLVTIAMRPSAPRRDQASQHEFCKN